ncbi:MAG: MFS transporter [Clostridium sp.]
MFKVLYDDKRSKLNIILFTIVFAIMGGVKGIVGDAFRSYLKLSNDKASNELSMLIGFSMIFLVIALLFIKKVGHRNMFMIITILMGIAFVLAIYSKDYYAISFSSIILHLGDKAFDIMMALVFMAYTNKDNRIYVFTRAIILNVLVGIVVKMFDGKIAVLHFANSMGITYDKANKMTAHVGVFKGQVLLNYIDGFKFVLWIAVILTIGVLILLSLMKEKREDYIKEEGIIEEIGKIKEKAKIKIFNKYTTVWIIYAVLMGIESNFITPNLEIYFNRMLHISRGETSTILAMQSLGMLVFLVLTPWMMRKMGNIKFFGILIFLSGPVMIVMGLGNFFLPWTGLVMGISIFLRYGFTHAVHPIQDSIQLLIVKKEMRPIFLAIITGINAIISIIVGFIGAKTLFSTLRGYENLFYFFGAVFMVSGIMIYITFKNKYNESVE